MMDQENSPQHNRLEKKKLLEAHEVQEVTGFLKRYGRLIGAGLLAASLTVLVIKGWTHYRLSRQTKAEQMMVAAQNAQQLEDVVKKYSSTPAAPAALLTLAKTRFNNGETAQARTDYQRFLKKYKKHEMAPVAELGLAYCTEAEGDFNGAAAQFAAFSKKNNASFLSPQAVLGVARCMEQAGRTDEARIVLEDFLAEHTGTVWAGPAENALKSLTAAKK
jgi:TolA-binding protein